MAGIFDIPKEPKQIADAGRMIIRTFGLGSVKTEIYKGNIPQGETRPDEGLSRSKFMGSLVLSNLVIKAQKWTDFNGNDILSFKEDVVFDTVLLSVGLQKLIVDTPVQGRNGPVFEYISDGAYAINIKGVITAQNGQDIKDQMRQLMEALQAQVALTIESWYLDLFNIKSIVVTYFEFAQSEGSYSTQPFEIHAYSDEPIELIIK